MLLRRHRRQQALTHAQERFLEASDRAERRQAWTRRIALMLLLLVATIASGAWFWINQQNDALRREAFRAAENEARALTALSNVASREGRYVEAVQLALAAWPRHPADQRPQLAATLDALSHAQRRQRQLVEPVRHERGAGGAAFDADGRWVLSWSDDGLVRLWDAATGRDLVEPVQHGGGPGGAAFDADGRRVLSWGYDGLVRLWDAATGRDLVEPVHHEGGAWGAAFDADGRRVLSWGDDGLVRLRSMPPAPGRNLIEIACNLLPTKDLAEVEGSSGIRIEDPICKPPIPLPDFSRMR